MSTREMVIGILDLLTEEQLTDVLMFAEDFLTPNAETKKAIEETEYILKHPDEYKSYTNIEEILNDE
ncbi:MAG: hypothetical protein ACI4JM_04835 [Oscillospiraceae bacterium]